MGGVYVSMFIRWVGLDVYGWDCVVGLIVSKDLIMDYNVGEWGWRE